MEPKINPWDGLETPAPPAFSTRTVDGGSSNQFMWIKDSRGLVGLGLTFTDNVEGRFVSSNLQNIEIEVQSDKKTLTFLLKEEAALRQFRIFCEDCIDSVEQLQTSKPSVVLTSLAAVVENWVELFGSNNKKRLSKSSELGLIGELLVMRNILMVAGNPRDSVLSWHGPKRHEQDFSINSSLIEVKCQLASKDKVFSISSLDQLDDISGQIYISHVGVSPASKSSVESFSLPSLVDEMIVKLSADNYTIDTFLGLLELVGYHHDGEMSFDHYVESFMNIFKVTNGFPKIIKSDVHKAIDKCSYRINAAMLGDWQIPKNQLLKEIAI
jgi:hypothetical protein